MWPTSLPWDRFRLGNGAPGTMMPFAAPVSAGDPCVSLRRMMYGCQLRVMGFRVGDIGRGLVKMVRVHFLLSVGPSRKQGNRANSH